MIEFMYNQYFASECTISREESFLGGGWVILHTPYMGVGLNDLRATPLL